MPIAEPPPQPPGRRSRSGNPAVRSGEAAMPLPPPRRPAARPLTPRGTPSPPGAAEVLPPDGATYPQLLRGPGYHWARSLAGVAFGLGMFAVVTGLVSQLVVAVGWLLRAGGRPYADYYREAFAFERPVGMLGANLGLVCLIPIAGAAMVLLHRVRPRWLVSVQPGIRWRYLLVCLGIAVVSLNGVVLLSMLVSGTPAVQRQVGFWGFLVVILLTSPLQAAAEEVFFRGYLMQALGSLVAGPWFGIVVSSVVFALLHGTQNLPLFVDRLAFGLLAALLVWRTGGLEAGIAAHVVNNVFAYLIAASTTSIADLRLVRSISWLDAAFDVGGFALFAMLAYLAYRALRLRHVVDLATPAPTPR